MMSRPRFIIGHVATLWALFGGCGDARVSEQSRLKAALAASELCIGDVNGDDIDLLSNGHGTEPARAQAPLPLNNARFSAASHVAVGPARNGLCLVNFDTKRSTCFEGIAAEDFAVSPQGRWLVYNGVDRVSGASGLFVLDVSTGQRQRLSVSGRKGSWSPDEQRVVYEEGSEVRVIERTGHDARKIATGGNPTWSSTNVIAYVSASRTFEVVSPEGKPNRTLGTAQDFLGGLQWSPDGRYLLGAKVGWDGRPISECLHDRISIVIIDAASGRRTEWNQYCGPGAWRFTWIPVPDVCAAERSR